MQCHVEMTAEMIRAWYLDAGEALHPSASVQSAEQAEERIAERVLELNRVAARLYDRWVEGLRS